MKVIKNILLMTMLSTLTIAAYADTPTTPAPTPTPTATTPSSGADFSGTYQCQGYDPFGKSNYSYPTATFTKNGDTYSIQWLSANGYPLLLGTGVTIPDVNNAIAVVFWDPKKPDYFGVAIYQHKSDGSLQANWTLQAQKQVGTETCTKSK